MYPSALRPKSSASLLSKTGAFLTNFLAKGALLGSEWYCETPQYYRWLCKCILQGKTESWHNTPRQF